MKKLIGVLACLLMLGVLFAGCAEKDESGGASKNVEGELADLVEKIYENLDDSVQLPGIMNTELTAEGTQFNPNIKYFIGSDEIKFTEGLVSEAAIGAQAYSLVLLRMDGDFNIDEVREKVKTGTVDGEHFLYNKWICASVDPGDVIVDSIGDLLVIIVSDDSAEIHEAFKKLAE